MSGNTPPCPSCEFDPDFVKPLDENEYWRICSECLLYLDNGIMTFKRTMVIKEP